MLNAQCPVMSCPLSGSRGGRDRYLLTLGICNLGPSFVPSEHGMIFLVVTIIL